jgi:hypothetical protein
MQYLPVDKSQIPVRMSVLVDGEQFELGFAYNASRDFFTASLAKRGEEIITGEKVCIDMPLFSTRELPFPRSRFIPMDLSGAAEAVTFENFGETVLIYAFSIGPGGEAASGG